ncbi:hypothetical protein RRG08_027167 [Elysia crispata]|uniref:Uncharacterized protein n=1 Tax=Elysia crispata TaxID=231223 RepID=A0AAE1B6B4_9GAST|nr:hypothetical protein RRG08_027167 [Elysia crispata]
MKQNGSYPQLVCGLEWLQCEMCESRLKSYSKAAGRFDSVEPSRYFGYQFTTVSWLTESRSGVEMRLHEKGESVL